MGGILSNGLNLQQQDALDRVRASGSPNPASQGILAAVMARPSILPPRPISAPAQIVARALEVSQKPQPTARKQDDTAPALTPEQRAAIESARARMLEENGGMTLQDFAQQHQPAQGVDEQRGLSLTDLQRQAIESARARLEAEQAPSTSGQPTRAQMLTALRNAHEAEDTDAARRIAAMIQRHDQASQSDPQGSPEMPTANGLIDNLAAHMQANPQPTPAPRSQPVTPSGGTPAWAAAQEARLDQVNSRNPSADVARDARPLGYRIADNLVGYDDGFTSAGERAAGLLNNAGESMTVGVVGDEAAGIVDGLLNRRGMDAEENTAFYRDQEAELWENTPALAMGSEIAGALLGPAKGLGAVIGRAPTTAAGIARAGGIGGILGGIHGGMEGEGTLGDRATDAALGAGVGILGGAVTQGIGQGFTAGIRRLAGTSQGQSVARGIAELRQSAQQLYDTALSGGGVTVPAGAMTALRTRVTTALQDAGYNTRLHPRLTAAVDEITDISTGSQPLARLEQARRVLSNAAQSTEPDERRLASLALQRMDDFLSDTGGTGPLRTAREMWSRLRRIETIEKVVEDASNARNFATALQSGFRSLLKSRRRIQGFTEAERAAIRDLARGGSATTQGLHSLGRLLSINSLAGVGAAGGAGALAGPMFGAVPPIVGALAKGAGNAGLRQEVNGLVASMLPRTPALNNPLINALSPAVSATAGPQAASPYR